MNTKGKLVTILLGFATLGLVATVTLSARQATASKPASSAKAPTSAKTTVDKAASQAPKPAPKGGGGPMFIRKTTPPLPAMGFAPVRPMDIVRATYDFAAQHPEILSYVPCYCGCGAEGHKHNESCFIARRDAKGNVTEWDTHGFGCAICVDVAREAMQLYSSGADVHSIRTAIEKRWAANVSGRTPTPFPPKK